MKSKIHYTFVKEGKKLHLTEESFEHWARQKDLWLVSAAVNLVTAKEIAEDYFSKICSNEPGYWRLHSGTTYVWLTYEHEHEYGGTGTPFDDQVRAAVVNNDKLALDELLYQNPEQTRAIMKEVFNEMIAERRKSDNES